MFQRTAVCGDWTGMDGFFKRDERRDRIIIREKSFIAFTSASTTRHTVLCVLPLRSIRQFLLKMARHARYPSFLSCQPDRHSPGTDSRSSLDLQVTEVNWRCHSRLLLSGVRVFVRVYFHKSWEGRAGAKDSQPEPQPLERQQKSHPSFLLFTAPEQICSLLSLSHC